MPLYIVTKGRLNKEKPVKAILSDAWRMENALYHAMDVFNIASNDRLWTYEYNPDGSHEFVVVARLQDSQKAVR